MSAPIHTIELRGQDPNLQGTSTHPIKYLRRPTQISKNQQNTAHPPTSLTTNADMPRPMQPYAPNLKHPLEASPELDIAPLVQRLVHFGLAEPVLDELDMEVPAEAVVVTLDVLARSEVEREVAERAIRDTAAAGAVGDAEGFEGLVGTGYVWAWGTGQSGDWGGSV